MENHAWTDKRSILLIRNLSYKPLAAPALAHWKGQSEFVDMAIQHLSSGTRALFVIIGDEIYDTTGGANGVRQALDEKIRKSGYEDRIKCTGFMNPIEALNGLDVMVHGSKEPEPFGRVVIEAMACGVPVVASRGGGIPEIIQEDKTGILYPMGNTPLMAEAVTKLLASPSLRGTLATAALTEVREKFTVENYVNGILKIYEGLLSQ